MAEFFLILFIAAVVTHKADATANVSGWYCNGINPPVSLSPDGDVQCMSLNGHDCLWAWPCDLEQLANTSVHPLVCGQMHQGIYGITGYDTPSHWCAVGRTFFARLNATATAAVQPPTSSPVLTDLSPVQISPTSSVLPAVQTPTTLPVLTGLEDSSATIPGWEDSSSTQNETIPVQTPTTSRAPRAYGAYKLMGCFKDDQERDLSLWPHPNTFTWTIETCASSCLNYPYFGLQYAGACFCGFNYGRYGSATNCDMRCNQNRNQECGGEWANSIYQQPVQTQTASPLATVPAQTTSPVATVQTQPPAPVVTAVQTQTTSPVVTGVQTPATSPVLTAVQTPTTSAVQTPTISPVPTDWQCVSDINVPLSLTPSGDVQCMSLNAHDCLWSSSRAGCLAILRGTVRSSLQPLVCGDMHKSIYGGTGYENANNAPWPDHWCYKGRASFGGLEDSSSATIPVQTPATSPVPAVQTQTPFYTEWQCVNNINTPISLSPSGDVQCMSLNARDCLWTSSRSGCVGTVRDLLPLDRSSLHPLVCGAMHKRIYGGTGYEDANGTPFPDHWCYKGRAQLGSSKLVGCFKDQQARDFSLWPYPNTFNWTIETCALSCINYPYFGLQYAGACFCGSSYGRYGSASNCDMPCHQNRAQICGGEWANSVYQQLGYFSLVDFFNLTATNEAPTTPPTVIPIPTPTTLPTDWECVDDIYVPISQTFSGDVQCMSLNAHDCLWTQSKEQCVTTLQSTDRASLRPLVCGNMHKSKYGGTGYEDANGAPNPAHWCYKGRAYYGFASLMPLVEPPPPVEVPTSSPSIVLPLLVFFFLNNAIWCWCYHKKRHTPVTSSPVQRQINVVSPLPPSQETPAQLEAGTFNPGAYAGITGMPVPYSPNQARL